MAATSKEATDEFEYQLQAQKEFLEGKKPQQLEGYTYVDPSDGTVYEWDSEKRAWFPKVGCIKGVHTIYLNSVVLML